MTRTLTREWMLDASCTDSDPELFFPQPGDADIADAAKNVCRHCAVQRECRIYADELGVGHGIWGGQNRYLRDDRYRSISREARTS